MAFAAFLALLRFQHPGYHCCACTKGLNCCICSTGYFAAYASRSDCLCWDCSAPDLRITHAAFVTLSLGGLDGGSQWVILFKTTMSKNGRPLSSLVYAIASMDRRGLHTSVHNPIVLQCVYPCRPYQIAGQRSEGLYCPYLLTLHTLGNCCILVLSVLYDTPHTGYFVLYL